MHNFLPAALAASHHHWCPVSAVRKVFPLGQTDMVPGFWGCFLSSSAVLNMESLPEQLWAIFSKGLPTILAAQRHHGCPESQQSCHFPAVPALHKGAVLSLICSLFHVCAALGLGTLSCSCAVSSASTQYRSSGASSGEEKGRGHRGGFCGKLPPCQSCQDRACQ